jgi:hypothetical protein
MVEDHSKRRDGLATGSRSPLRLKKMKDAKEVHEQTIEARKNGYVSAND